MCCSMHRPLFRNGWFHKDAAVCDSTDTDNWIQIHMEGQYWNIGLALCQVTPEGPYTHDVMIPQKPGLGAIVSVGNATLNTTQFLIS